MPNITGVYLNRSREPIGLFSLKEHKGIGEDSIFNLHNRLCTNNMLAFGTKCPSCSKLHGLIKNHVKIPRQEKESNEAKKIHKLEEKNHDATKEKKKLKRQLKAANLKIEKLKCKVNSFMDNGKSIDIKSLSEAKKWECLCKLAIERIDK